MKLFSIIESLSYVGIALILVVTLFFEEFLGPMVDALLTYLLALFLLIVIGIKLYKRKKK